jgi:hypothetical protein
MRCARRRRARLRQCSRHGTHDDGQDDLFNVAFELEQHLEAACQLRVTVLQVLQRRLAAHQLLVHHLHTYTDMSFVYSIYIHSVHVRRHSVFKRAHGEQQARQKTDAHDGGEPTAQSQAAHIPWESEHQE